MNKEQFLYKYLNSYAPVAQEGEGQDVWQDYISDFCSETKQDAYGTCYGLIPGSTGTRKHANKVVIEVIIVLDKVSLIEIFVNS